MSQDSWIMLLALVLLALGLCVDPAVDFWLKQ